MSGSPDDQIEIPKLVASVVLGPPEDAASVSKFTAVVVLTPPRRKRFVFPMKF